MGALPTRYLWQKSTISSEIARSSIYLRKESDFFQLKKHLFGVEKRKNMQVMQMEQEDFP